MPAPAATPAIKVPSFAQLTTAPAAPTEGAPKVEPAAPVIEEVEIKPSGGTPEAAPVLETEIIGGTPPKGNAPVGTPKAAKDFKQERLAGKQDKIDMAQLQQQFDQTKMELVQRDLDLEKLRKDLAERDKTIEAEKKKFDLSSKDLEDLRTGYFEQNRATWNPLEDTEFQAANQNMITRLRDKLPMRVPAGEENGQKREARVFFDTLLQQNGAPQGLANILDAYTLGKGRANERGMNLAVNAMAQFLGADVDMTDTDESKWRLLQPTDPAFRAIEAALDEAAPFHVQRTQRYARVQQEGPAMAKQQFEQRESGIRQTLASGIFLAPDVATARLKEDPNDSTALVSMIINQVPVLKEIADRKLNEFAPAFAALGDKLYLPGLASANPSEIAAHRQREAQTRHTVSEAMRFAVIGAVMGPVLSGVIAERDAAEERATAASLLTNPGGEAGPKAGKEGQPPAAQLQTEIVTGQ